MLEKGQESAWFDLDGFQELTFQAINRLWKLGFPIPLLSPDRLFVGKLPASNSDIGGFYSKKAKGFMYLDRFGWSVLLNQRKYSIKDELVTLDMARNYIHDSIHAATFRLFRLNHTPIPDKEISYAQYGFNFRRPDGFSYSSVQMTDESPERINVNLFMDGLTMLAALYALQDPIEQLEYDGLDERERWILADLKLDSDALPHGRRVTHFHETVLKPTIQFVQTRSKDPQLMWLFFEAMLGGKLSAIKDQLGEFSDPSASDSFGELWKSTFMRDSWVRT